MAKKKDILEPGVISVTTTKMVIAMEEIIDWFATDIYGMTGQHRFTVTLQTSGKEAVCGHFRGIDVMDGAGAWSTKEGELSSEINFNTTQLHRPFTEIIGTAGHEVGHFYNYSLRTLDTKNENYQKFDCSKSGRHSKIFKGNVEPVGFEVTEAFDSYGWGYTKMGAELEAKALAKFAHLEPIFNLYKTLVPKKTPTENKSNKYQCSGTDCITDAKGVKRPASVTTARIVTFARHPSIRLKKKKNNPNIQAGRLFRPLWYKPQNYNSI